MLIGAHVSPAGGPAQAIQRGVERSCRSIQFFNQNPRAWRPREYSAAEISDYRAAMEDSEVDALLIHAVYLINCASEDAEIRAKSLRSLTASLQAGDALGAHAVVLHAGSAKGGSVDEAIVRAGELIREALAGSEACPLHLENTAGAGGTLGRSFDELARLLEAAGGDERLGLCLDSCHLLASGYDGREAGSLAAVLDDCERTVGGGLIGSLHVNDSKVGLGANSDRHAELGQGELGRGGCAAFLSEPRFEGLPCVLETAGVGGHGPETPDLDLARELRAEGLAARR